MKRTLKGVGVAEMRLPLILLVLVACCLPRACFGWNEDQDVPSPSQGDIIFNVDIVTFYESPGRNLEEIYCMVPNEQIRYIQKDGAYGGKLRYEIKVIGEDGKTVEATEKTIEVNASSSQDALDRTVVQVLQSEIRVPPGIYEFRVTLEDLNARKKTLLAYLLRRHKTGTSEVVVESKEFREGEFLLSDIEFARSLRRTSEGMFQKSGYEVVPNPQRRYGRLLPELAVFFEVYDLRRTPGTDSVDATYSIVNREGSTIFSNEMPMALHGAKFGATALFDVTSLTGGSYALVLTVRDGAGTVLAASERKFDVVWSFLSWGKYDSEKIEEMTYIFNDKEMEEFKSISPGEQEKFLVNFWKVLDPTPGTADNEAMVEHYRRVAYADEHFGTAGVRGALSDRGRIYIKYGQPDDVQSFYSDYEFVRDKHDMEGGTNPVPTDPFSRVGIKASQQSDEASSDQRGGSTVHGKPYETWTYDGPGNPVRRLSQRMPSSAGMRFMFVDERGVGDFKLVYSSEKQEY